MDASDFTTTQIVAFTILLLWDAVWRGFALWRAGRNNHAFWFVALLVFNTVGILPIIYLLTHRKQTDPTNG